MTDKPRLIEHAFPLKQASLDSVHEKNVRHGHISTLHIWPARRPLAACRAALIATLLPDPGDPEKRKELVEKLGGRVVEKVERKKMPSGKIVENIKEETVGGILHWKREMENKETLDWFRDEIKKAYGGRAPKVLDPFAGGGAIPLEAMRLGCETTAIDINPVAWFILKCTLEYPQKLAGQKWPLPEFILKDRDFMEAFFKAQGFKGAMLRTQLEKLGLGENAQPLLKNFPVEDPLLEADLAWHVRAWGKWVLNYARKDLAKYYPTYADFEPLKDIGKKYEKREMKLVPLKEDGTIDIDSLNVAFDKKYLDDKTNPRWVAKPTAAYLWARTVTCKNCRATVPLLKTRWLCKKVNKRVLLTMEPNQDKTGVFFGVQNDVPVKGGNPAQRREHDKRIGEGTMSRSGGACPCCGIIITKEDMHQEGLKNRLSTVMTCAVMDGLNGKEYRLPSQEEIQQAENSKNTIEEMFSDIPFGIPHEKMINDAKGKVWCVLYGLDEFYKLFSSRQLMSMGIFIKATRSAHKDIETHSYPSEWVEGIIALLASSLSRLADYSSSICIWALGEFLCHTFTRFALPITWDFAEGNPIGETSGNYEGAVGWVCRVLDHTLLGLKEAPLPYINNESATEVTSANIDVIVTDPPYYDAIGYSVLMDFFYVWLRRTLHGLSIEIDQAFKESLSLKWNHEKCEGELVDDASRFNGDKQKSKACYEDGMYCAFQSCVQSLKPEGRLVIVFANKQPDAWETLVSAIIRAGFVVNGSWPIQTERETRMRALASAALSSSVWLVCKKRPLTARPGWDNKVLEEMRENITKRLREFWDAGIRGPDFVWAATGPALEAYSKHPVVKKANEPRKLLEVSEFLRHVRRMVVDFVVGRVLSQDGETEEISGLDDVTTYYLLHRHDFGMDDAPSGPCILYAISSGLTDGALVNQFDILARTGGKSTPEPDAGEYEDEEVGGGTGSTLRLKHWNQRKRQSMGYDPAIDKTKTGAQAVQIKLFPEEEKEKTVRRREIPLIDQIHRLMHLWKAGELVKVDDYLDSRALLRNNAFHQVLQALIELAPAGSDERSILENISNQLKPRGVTVDDKQRTFLDRQQDP